MSNDTSDNEDIQRQIGSLYVSANILRRKFYCCSDYIKIMLFKSYCSSMYGSSLWCHFSKSVFSRLGVAYNNSLRSLLGLPRWRSATQMFVLCDSMTFAANLRKSRHSLLKRLEHSGNVYITCLTSLERMLSSILLSMIHTDLYTIYNVQT